MLANCSGELPGSPLACQPISVETPDGLLIGGEDLAVLNADTVLVSAHNRRAPHSHPAGVYAVKIAPEDKTWTARPVLSLEADHMPKGFALSEDTSQLALIVRPISKPTQLALFRKSGADYAFDKWLVDANTWPKENRQADETYPCNMNDAAFASDDYVFFTDDRKACSLWQRAYQNVMGVASGRLMVMDPDGVVSDLLGSLAFANGVASIPGGSILFTETRGQRLQAIGDFGGRPLPAAPDNISFDAETQTAWIAAFPSLFRYALFQQGLLENTGSLLFAASEDGTRLFHTKDFSGATTAVKRGNTLILGGAFSEGLALCEISDA
ncbi:MAG: hypothetical protein AAF562_13475 [Pseudomonadota bacterium]